MQLHFDLDSLSEANPSKKTHFSLDFYTVNVDEHILCMSQLNLAEVESL